MTAKKNNPVRKYFFISDFHKWGGAVTFTAHLLKSLGKNHVYRISGSSDRRGEIGDFGYGIKYKLGMPSLIEQTSDPFITDFFHYESMIPKMKRNDITVVIHDPTEIPNHDKSCLQYWNIICIRRALQNYLKEKYNVNSKFMYHPFWPYDTKYQSKGSESHNSNSLSEQKKHSLSVSISRIDYGKNIELIMQTNKLLEAESSYDKSQLIRMHGPFNQQYVDNVLGGSQHFAKFYCGTFPKSFDAISKILNGTKFVVDLSTINNDGGGTQYTFLEAIHHRAALVINRKWIENLPPELCDFKEDYNCYAVSNAKELSELIKNSKNIDTSRIVRNSEELLHRHINANWSFV
jgi:hypothetical protein